jgi:hypothetical protein
MYARVYKRIAQLYRVLLVQYRRNQLKDIDLIFEDFSKRLNKDLFSILKTVAIASGKRNIGDLERLVNNRHYNLLEHFGLVGIHQELPFVEEYKQIFDIFEFSIIDWIRNHSLLKATTIARNQHKRVRTVLEIIVEEGLGEEEGARRLQAVVGDNYARSAATRVARTEVHTAVNQATQRSTVATSAETNVEFNKVWISTEDSRTRPTHIDADGQTVGINEHFIVGEARLMFPGDPEGPPKEVINCRCQSLYEPQL